MEIKGVQSLNESSTQQYYNWLLVGESKTGKTSAFKTFPGKKLAIGLTPRTRAALAGSPDIDLIEHIEEETEKIKVRGSADYRISPRAWDALWDTSVELWNYAHSDEPFPYSAILLDDLTTVVEYSMNYILSLRKKNGDEVAKGLAGAPQEAHYMPQMGLMQRFLKTVFLPLPCHILVSGHMAFRENKDTGVSQYWPKCYGNLREHIASWFDEVYETKRENTKRKDPKTGKFSDELRFVWKTQGYGLKQFLGSTLYRPGLWEEPFEVDLTDGGFNKMLQLAAKGGPSAT